MSATMAAMRAAASYVAAWVSPTLTTARSAPCKRKMCVPFFSLGSDSRLLLSLPILVASSSLWPAVPRQSRPVLQTGMRACRRRECRPACSVFFCLHNGYWHTFALQTCYRVQDTAGHSISCDIACSAACLSYTPAPSWVGCKVHGHVALTAAIVCMQRDGCPKIVNLGSAKTDLFYERKKYGFKKR